MDNTFSLENFIVLLAAQRSGTHALRNILSSGPIFCYGEVFHPEDTRRPSNFFNFKFNQDIELQRPSKSEKLFKAFLEHLWNLAQLKKASPYVLIDVKYNSLLSITTGFQSFAASPYMLEFFKRNGMKVIHLTRKNYLRRMVSSAIAEANETWATRDKNTLKFETCRLDPKVALRRCELFRREDKSVEQWLANYKACLRFDYGEIFPDISCALDPRCAARIADWLQIPDDFSTKSTWVKQSNLPLPQVLENYDEVARCLEATEFDRCLADERMYVSGEAESGNEQTV